MDVSEKINQAIGAHGLWKQRLRKAIDTGNSEFSVAIVRVDNQCEFGKWLYSVSPQIKVSENYATIKKLHAKFHDEAARILTLALQGKKSEAEQLMTAGSDFANISAELTMFMMKWKKDIAQSLNS